MTILYRWIHLSSNQNDLDKVVNSLQDFQSLAFDKKFIGEQGEEIEFQSYISTFLVPADVADKLRQLATAHACTLHTILMTLPHCLLSVYCSDTSDIILGSIIPTHSQSGVSYLFGPFINTVPIRTHLPKTSQTTFIDLLHPVRKSVLLGMEHQMVPFADVVQGLRSLSTDPSLFTYMPVVRVLFEMNSFNLFARSKQFQDRSEWIGINNTGVLLPYVKSDIDLEIVDYGANQPFRVAFNLNRTLFKA